MSTASAPPRAPGSIPAKPSRLGVAFASLRIRDFRLLTLFTLAVGISQWGQQVGMGWLVYTVTGSAVQLGAVATTGGAVAMLLTPVGGVLADRFPRKKVLNVTATLGGVQALILFALVAFDLVQVWHIYAFAVINAFFLAANGPAMQSLVYDITTDETLQNAVTVNAMAMNLARVAGPPIVGVLASLNVALPFLVVGLTRLGGLVIVLAMSGVSRQAVSAVRNRNPFKDLGEGLRYVVTDRLLFALLMAAFLPSAIVYPYLTFFPQFSDEVLGTGAYGVGLMLATTGLGSIVGLFLLSMFGKIRYRGRALLVGYLVQLSILLVFSRMTSLPLAMLCLGVGGMFFGNAIALNQALFQTYVRNEMRGRAIALYQMTFSVMVVTSVFMGFTVNRLGVADAFLAHTVVAIAAVVLLAATSRSIWRVE